MWRGMAGADAWIPVFTGMTRGGVTGCGGSDECGGDGGGGRVDSRFHGNDKGGVTGCGGDGGVWRGMTGCGGNDGGNRVDSRFHGNDKGGWRGVAGMTGAIAWIPVFTGMTRGDDGVWRE